MIPAGKFAPFGMRRSRSGPGVAAGAAGPLSVHAGKAITLNHHHLLLPFLSQLTLPGPILPRGIGISSWGWIKTPQGHNPQPQGGTCCPSVGHGDIPGDTRMQRTPWGEQSRDESCLTVLRASGLHHQGLWCCSSRL